MKIDIHLSNNSELSRISEFSQPANKCTNGIRYSVNDLNNYIENGGTVYAVYGRATLSIFCKRYSILATISRTFDIYI